MTEIALCFSGQPRCLEKAQVDMLKLMEGEEYDVFGHIWQSDELLSSWGHNMGWENRQTKVHPASDFVDMYSPKNYYIEDYKNSMFYTKTALEAGYRNMTNKVWSSYSQFYSMMKSFESLSEYESQTNHQYKYLARFRMDYDIDWSTTTENWEQMKKRIDENPNLVMVNFGWNWPNGDGISGLLAIGAHDAMIRYSKFFEFYPQIVEENPNWTYDESNIKWYLEKIAKVDVEECGISIGVYR